MAGTSGLIRSPPNGCIGSNPAELMIPALCRVHARYRSCLASVNTSGGANNGPKYVPEWSNPRRGLPRLTAADESRARVPRPLPSSNTRRPNQMQLIALPGSIHRPASDLSGASILQIPSSRSPGPREQMAATMRKPRQPEGMESSSATPSSVGAPLVRSITRKAAPLSKWDISFRQCWLRTPATASICSCSLEGWGELDSLHTRRSPYSSCRLGMIRCLAGG